MNAVQLREHRRELLLRRRCPECAEPAHAGAVLRGEDCPRCGSALVIDAEGDHAAAMLDAVRDDWMRWRLLVYAIVFTSTLFAGMIPLGGVVMTVGVMFAGHVMLLRRPLRWLTPGRRVVTRVSMKLWFAFLGLTSFVGNVLAAPLLAAAGAGALVSALMGIGATALYLEGGLLLIERRIELEAQGSRLGFREWAIPVGLFGGLVVVAVAGVIATWGMLNALATMDVPGVADIARWLLEVDR